MVSIRIGLEGIPDTAVITSSITPEPIIGDVNGDLNINVGDAVYIINYVFRGGPPPEPMETGDVNGDQDVNVAEAVYLINYVFRNGPAPVVPPGF